MTDNLTLLRACQGRVIDLVELAGLAAPEDRALLERKIQFIRLAFQEIVWVRQQIDTDTHLEETAEMISLCWQIREMLQLAEVHITHNLALR
jgi:hypothetical protein